MQNSRLKFDRKYRKLALVAGIVVILDQITKAMVLKYLPLYASINVIPGFFNLIHIHNPGGAFGFMAEGSSSARALFFLVMSMAAIGLVFDYYRKIPSAYGMLSLGFALILGGALGNLIDRLRMGKVVDFLDVYVRDWHWPAFNVADSAITIGMAIFIFHLLFGRLPE